MNRYLFYISELYAFSIVRPLQAVIRNRGDEVAWFLENETRLKPYLRPDEIQLKTVRDVQAFNPCAVFVPGNIVPDFFPGIKVEVFHGFHARKRNSDRGHFRIRNFFDLYCTQGPDTTEPFKELAKKHGFFEVVETGWPKMDPLFADSKPEPAGRRPEILLTSTFTPRLSAAPALFDTVQRLSKTGKWKWTVTFHPKMADDIVKQYQAIQNDNLEFVETDDIIPLLKKADCMVSDTTSVISEFILQYKPVVTFNNRIPYPYMMNITDPSLLEETVEYVLTRPEPLMKEIRSYADRIHPYRDGRSSVRVLEAADQLVLNGRSHLKPKPVNFIRRMKVRKKLRYYRF